MLFSKLLILILRTEKCSKFFILVPSVQIYSLAGVQGRKCFYKTASAKMSHKTSCKQRIEETLKKTQLNKAVTWIIGDFILFFYVPVFENSLFLGQTLVFQSPLLSCLTRKHLCISNFLALENLSLTQILRIKNRYLSTNREGKEKKST